VRATVATVAATKVVAESREEWVES
jgi:hypothetical protein